MPARLAASLTLIRPARDGLEVFWARRRADRAFLGGFHAFFAGSVESGEDVRIAAFRECFEECGVLITTRGMERLDVDSRISKTFAAAPQDLALSRLHDFGWWTTPSWLKPSFTTAFFGLLLTHEEGQYLADLADHLDPQEFSGGSWISAQEALETWKNGRAYLTTPLSKILEALANTKALSAAKPLGESCDDPPTSEAIEICGGVVLLPLKTPTLPPATHTNALMIGQRKFVLIDPGPSDGESLSPLLKYLEIRQNQGDQLLGIALTHHHGDHIGGIHSLSSIFDVPLFAHGETLNRLDDLPLKKVELIDGQELPIDHPGPLRALHTPGHAPGHLAFYLPQISLVVAGDLITSKGTIVVDPPEGHMGSYLKSLHRIRDIDPRALIPSHGHLIADPIDLIDHYIAHRHHREERILQALHENSPATTAQLVATVYAEIPRSLWPLAQRSLLAHLEYLVEKDLARRQGDEFQAI